MPVPQFTLRLAKGAPLAPGELDGNFTIIGNFANGLETRLAVSTNADGTFKVNIVGTDQITDQCVTAAKILNSLAGAGLLKATNADPFSVSVDGTTIILNGANKVSLSPTCPGLGGLYILAQDQKASGTNGGTYTSGLEITRVLNTLATNEVGGATALSGSANANAPVGNKLTLPAGTYRCRIRVPGFQCQVHKAWLKNVTANTVILYGTQEYSGAGAAYAVVYSEIVGKFTLNVQSDLEVRCQGAATEAANGLGVAAGIGTEIFTNAEFWKVS